MELQQVVIPATLGKVRNEGSTGFSATFGKTLRIELSPEGPDILNISVPANKKWINGKILLSFDEVDA